MPAVSENRLCGTCGKDHTFCYPYSNVLLPGKRYEYTCPTTKGIASFPTEERNGVHAVCPPGAVIVREVGR